MRISPAQPLGGCQVLLRSQILSTPATLASSVATSRDVLQAHNVQWVQNHCVTLSIHDDNRARSDQNKVLMRHRISVAARSHYGERAKRLSDPPTDMLGVHASAIFDLSALFVKHVTGSTFRTPTPAQRAKRRDVKMATPSQLRL